MQFPFPALGNQDDFSLRRVRNEIDNNSDRLQKERIFDGDIGWC
jgi:hypothetical protein